MTLRENVGYRQSSVAKEMRGLGPCKGRLGWTRLEDDAKLWVFDDTFDNVSECFSHADGRLC